MCDNVLTWQYWAIGTVEAEGRTPAPGKELVTGGTPRYRIYRTADGRFAAVAALEQKFWESFAKAIGLEPQFIDDRRDRRATIARVAEIIAGKTAAEWEPIFDKADCCCSIVQDVRAAVDDPHFKARGVFAPKLTNDKGESLPATPVPINKSLRPGATSDASAPALGAHNAEFGF